jgi:pimeloyl-ACP methyl ester carboxylesterase
MYDFEGQKQAGDAADRPPGLPRPPLVLTLLEGVRFAVEYPTSVALDLVVRGGDSGAGRPVLVLPGFSSDDLLTRRLRGHLKKLGYTAYGWGLGRNHGLTDRVVDGLPVLLDELYERHGEPVAVVGWSFGGLLARWLAHERPEAVSRVVCLGSPWRPEGEVTRTTAMFERARERHGLSSRAQEIVETLRGPLPVPATAIYSRTDGILNWRACTLDAGPGCENIEVPSSHIGLASNPLALAVLADRLATDPQRPEPFKWSRALWRFALGTPDDLREELAAESPGTEVPG